MLQRSMEKKRAGEEGFTLVELLVVIVILGVLAAIVVFAVGGINDKGEKSACAADKSSLETAEEAYYAQQPDPPSYATMGQLVSGGYIHEASTLHPDLAPTGGGTGYDVGACTK